MHKYSYTFGSLLIALIIGVSLGAIGVYLALDTTPASPLISSRETKRIEDLERQLAAAQDQTLKTKEQLIASQKQNAELLTQRQELEAQSEPEFGILPSSSFDSDFISLVEPATLSSACLGDSVVMKWQSIEDIAFVDIYLTNEQDDVFLGTFSHTGTNMTHAVLLSTDVQGNDLPLNTPFEIKLEGHFSVEDRLNGRPSTVDTSNFSFPILDCSN